MRKYLLTGGIALGMVLSSITAISCIKEIDPGIGNNEELTLEQHKANVLRDKDLWTGNIQVLYEKPWERVIDDAIALLPQELRGRVEKISITDGGSIDYITNTLETQPESAADLIPSPLDRFKNLVSKNLALEINQGELGEYGKNKEITKVDGKYYAFPLNIESVITFYNTKTYPNAPTNIQAEFADPVGKKFAFQANNLWQGSSLMNGLFATLKNNDLELANQLWAEGQKPNVKASFLTNPETVKRLKEIWEYVNKLRNSTSNEFNKISDDANQRETVILSGLQKGTVDLTFDGPWVLNKIIGYILKANENDPVKAIEALNQIRAAKLPKLNQEQLRHFQGGWGYLINRTKATAGIATGTTAARDAAVAKVGFTKYFGRLLSGAQLSTQWIANAGKISTIPGVNVALNFDEFQVVDPTRPSTNNVVPTIDLTKFKATAGFETAINGIYTSVIAAVSNQALENIPQPSWPGGGYWAAWDALGLTNPALKTADEFINALKANVNLEVEKANT